MANHTTRRRWLQSGGAASAAALLSAAAARPAETATASEPPAAVYTRLGVKPFINCTATITRNGGSRQLPEVIEAIHHASHYHVKLNKLIAVAGERLSELLEVPWAMVSSGAASALAHATAACVAGGNPERRQQLPNLAGLPNEVIMPKWSRNQYDHSIRMLGTRIINIETMGEYRAAFSPRTAMVAVLGDRFGSDRPNLADLAPIAKERNVPVLVDAAADFPVAPNPYLQQGADLVAYSGGKILRGPQTAGMLVGREDLVRTATINAAPFGGFGRPMKVSKEEIVGMVTAVEVWFKSRDIEAEYREWQGWYEHIAHAAREVDGVEAEVQQPTRGGPFPTLRVSWDDDKIGLTASQMHHQLLSGDPPIMTWDYGDENFFVIRPVALKPDEYKVIARRVRSILDKAPRGIQTPQRAEPAGDIAGHWDVEIEFLRGRGQHQLFVETRGNEIVGTHVGTRNTGELKGTIDGDKVRFDSILPMEGSRLKYEFSGVLRGDQISGDIDLNEHPPARWVATRRTPA